MIKENMILLSYFTWVWMFACKYVYNTTLILLQKILQSLPKAYHVLNVVVCIKFTPTCKDNCHEKIIYKRLFLYCGATKLSVCTLVFVQ